MKSDFDRTDRSVAGLGVAMKSGIYCGHYRALILLALLSLATAALGPGTRGRAQSARPDRAVPKFSHVIAIFLENREFDEVIGNREMPHLNALADRHTLLTNYYAVSHPSLPNYLALIGGDTFGIQSDCIACFVKARSLPDLLEANGRTWRTYQESLPRAGFAGASSGLYVMKHNPFVYFENIRRNQTRRVRGVVPLAELAKDLQRNQLPDFAFIMPNLCNSAHDCDLSVADNWLSRTVGEIMDSPAFDSNSLLVLSWDEGTTNLGCCGAPPLAKGGRVATVLVSPLVKARFRDSTPYSHYSLLKTIEAAWGLESLGHTADAAVNLILSPWK